MDRNRYKENADILSYNPNLNINTRPDIEAYQDANYYENKYNGIRSTVVEQLEIHLPSKKVGKLNNVLSTINSIKEEFKTRLSTNSIATNYFNSEDSDKQKILDDNYNDMLYGTTELEVYSVLENIQDEVKAVKENYIVSIYGKDVDEDKMAEIDSAYLDKIDSYELNNKHEYINYFNIYYDTQISFLIGEYADRTTENVYNLSFIEDEKIVETSATSSVDIIQNSFDKNNELLTHDLYKHNSNKNDLDIAINNIFLAKQNLNIYLDTFSDYSSLGDEFEIINEIKQENINTLNDKLDTLVETVMMSHISKSDICDTLKKKSKIRGFFDREL